MRITRAQINDLHDILRIQKEAFKEQSLLYNGYIMQPMIETLEDARLALNDSVVLKAEIDGDIIGSIRAKETNGLCEIGRLSVSPNHRKKGIGSALVLACEKFFPKALFFELFTGNRSFPNIKLYESLGYKICGEKPAGAGFFFVYLRKKNTGNISQS